MLRRHRKLSIAGGIHFVTVVTGVRGNWFVEEDLCHPILESFEHHRRRMGIRCYGYVLMPDHFHALIEQNTRMTKLNYIHANPVRKGLVQSPEDYGWSSARFYWNGELGIVDITQP